MRKYSGDRIAVGALDVHKVRVGSLNQSLLLVLASLGLFAGVEQIVVLRSQGEKNKHTQKKKKEKEKKKIGKKKKIK
jgi:hypothetical protein